MSKVKELKATYLNLGIVFQDFFNYNSFESSMHFYHKVYLVATNLPVNFPG